MVYLVGVMAGKSRPREVGRRISGVLEAKGWVKTELIARSGLKQASVYEWLRGESEPRGHALSKLAQARRKRWWQEKVCGCVFESVGLVPRTPTISSTRRSRRVMELPKRSRGGTTSSRKFCQKSPSIFERNLDPIGVIGPVGSYPSKPRECPRRKEKNPPRKGYERGLHPC